MKDLWQYFCLKWFFSLKRNDRYRIPEGSIYRQSSIDCEMVCDRFAPRTLKTETSCWKSHFQANQTSFLFDRFFSKGNRLHIQQEPRIPLKTEAIRFLSFCMCHVGTKGRDALPQTRLALISFLRKVNCLSRRKVTPMQIITDRITFCKNRTFLFNHCLVAVHTIRLLYESLQMALFPLHRE